MPLKSRTRRSGHWSPSSRFVERIHSYAPTAPTAATPPIRKSRRVLRRSSRFSSLSGRTISGRWLFIVLHQFIAYDHASKIIPASPNDLRDMHNEERQIAPRQQE